VLPYGLKEMSRERERESEPLRCVEIYSLSPPSVGNFLDANVSFHAMQRVIVIRDEITA